MKQGIKDIISLENDIEFKKLVELLPEIIARTDREFNITFLNNHGLKCTGYAKEDIKKGLNIFELIKEKDRNKAKDNIEKILKKQKTGLNEYTITKKDGSNFQILANSNIIDDNGTFLGLRVVAMDLTEKNKAEEKIKQSEQKYQFLAENVNDIIFVQDMDLYIKYASPSTSKLLGYEPKDMGEIKIKDIMTKDSYKRATSYFKKYIGLAQKDKNIDIPLME